MFKVGEFVIYENAGVCKVTEISTVKMSGVDENKLFYFLQPVKIKDSRLYVGVESSTSRMRELISGTRARQLLEEMFSVPPLPIANEKMREEEYKKALRSCDCCEWIKALNALYKRKSEREEKGQKLPALDSNYFKLTKECLVTELALALNMPEAEVEDKIAETFSSDGRTAILAM